MVKSIVETDAIGRRLGSLRSHGRVRIKQAARRPEDLKEVRELARRLLGMGWGLCRFRRVVQRL